MRVPGFSTLLCTVLFGCKADSEDSDASEPASWALDYDSAFDSNAVHRIDIVITPEDYAAMQEDLASVAGGGGLPDDGGFPDGGGPPDGGGDPADLQAILDACDQLSVGDACSYTTADGDVDGECTDIMGDLACLGGQMPGDPGNGGMTLITAEPSYVSATVQVDADVWEHVGIRYKGNSSLQSSYQSGNRKLPFRLDFDQYQDDFPATDGQRFFGFESVAFSSNWSDDSQIREAYTAELFDQFGIPSAYWAFYRVYVDTGEGPAYWGLYTALEDPSDEPMLDRVLGDHKVNVYKPEGTGADWTVFDESGFVKKTNEDDADWSDVQAAMSALEAPQDDAATWREGLERSFDAPEFLRWLALNSVIKNWDTYGQMAHNYYLIADPDHDGRLMWVPWDNNMAMMDGGMGNAPGGDSAGSMLHTDVGDNWPLIRRLLDDPVYMGIYKDAVREAADGVYAEDTARQRFGELHELIAPYVVGDDGEEAGSTTISSEAAFESSVGDLSDWAATRHELVDEALAP